jgi:6-phosphogluconolactonase
MEYTGFMGTYTEGFDGRGAGIYSFIFDAENGSVKNFRVAAAADNPEFLVYSPSRAFLYVTNELNEFQHQKTGAVSAFAVGGERGEQLTFINQTASCGRSPCHIALTRNGAAAVVSNYVDGVLSAFPIREDGGIGDCGARFPLGRGENGVYVGSGVVADRQEAPHAHSFVFSPNGNAAFACDLGSDGIYRFDYDGGADAAAAGAGAGGVFAQWRRFETAPGSGPRHTLFHPNGEIVYAVNELSVSVDVYAADDGLVRRQSLPLLGPTGAADGTRNTAAALKFGGAGANPHFLYVSNRGHDCVAVFRIREDGALEPAGTAPSCGKTPRDFAVDPSGRFLLVCHQDSDNLVVFRIDEQTGLLQKIREYEAPSGVCVLF